MENQVMLGIVVGLIGVPIIQYVKNGLGVDDRLAKLIALVVSGVLGALALYISEQLGYGSFESMLSLYFSCRASGGA